MVAFNRYLEQCSDALSENQTKALNKYLNTFCEKLDLPAVLTSLKRKGSINPLDVKVIEAEATEQYQRKKLIDIIRKRGPAIYNEFQRELFSSGQIHLAELLSDTTLAGSMSLVHHFHPDWWSDSIEKETVCVPVTLDVDKNRYLGPSDCRASNFDSEAFSKKERQWAGQAAEDLFIKAFQHLNIGGVLIFGFDTMEFASVRRTQKLFKKRNIAQIECDFIFIHPSIGIFIIEVKATKQYIEEYSPIYQHAVRTTKKIREQIPLIYELLTDRKFNIPVHGAVCFPLASVGEFARDETVELIESFDDDHPRSLRNIFMSKILQHQLNEDELNSLKMFACSLAAYRSAKCISPVHNALAVHSMLEKQCFPLSTSKGTYFKNSVFLTDEQLSIIECNDSHQIVTGPPGTGKTLILLNKAMNMAKIEKAGRIRIITMNSACCKLVQRHFEINNDSNIKRSPIVGCTLNDIDPEDDVFIDDADSQSYDIISFLMDRQLATASTFVAVSSFQRSKQISNNNEDILCHKLNFYRHFDLRTVIRGTVSIADIWKREYPENYRFHMSHSIIGPAVREEKCDTVDEVLSNLLKHISQMQSSTVSSSLCVITENRANCDIIKNFLGQNDIVCGSLEDQLNNANMVAVAQYTETMSFEWPFVFIVRLNGCYVDDHSSMTMTAASRAKAKLVIIEKTFQDAQEEIDDQSAQNSIGNMEDDTTEPYGGRRAGLRESNIIQCFLRSFLTRFWHMIQREIKCLKWIDCESWGFESMHLF